MPERGAKAGEVQSDIVRLQGARKGYWGGRELQSDIVRLQGARKGC